MTLRLALLACILSPLSVFAQGDLRPNLIVVRLTDSRPVIDGVVNDEQRHRIFPVYNDRRDTSAFTPEELLGRSFIVKYTRLFTF
jgi:hypothetical protein